MASLLSSISGCSMILPLKMNLALPVSENKKTKIKIGPTKLNARIACLSSNTRNHFLTKCLSSAPRARDHNHNYPFHSIRLSDTIKFYSSKNDLRNSGDRKDSTVVRMSQNDAPATTEEQDTEKKPCSESKNKYIPMSPRGERFKEEFLSKIVPWENITVSLDNFPYHIDEHTKTLLMECVASHLKQKKLRKYRGRFKSSSERILLQSIPGTELYRERLVSALARELQVPLLKLDSSVLPPYDLSEDFRTDCGADENSLESDEESDCCDDDDDDHASDEDDANDEEEDDSDDETTTDDDDSDEEVDTKLLKKGDRVKYVGEAISIEEVNNRTLSPGQRGEVYEVNGERAAVVFNVCGLGKKEAKEDEKNTEIARQALVIWLDVKDVEKEHGARTHDCYIAMEVLYEVLESHQPMIVYFPDSFLWPSMSYYASSNRFLGKVKEIFNQLSEEVVMICAQNKREAGLEEMEIFSESLKKYTKRLQVPRQYQVNATNELFTNVVCIKPPKDQDLLNTFVKQIEEDRLTVISEGNLSKMHKVLKDHNLSCMNLELANVEDMILTRQKAEKIVGWATNHYLSSCPIPCVNGEKLHIPHESIKLAVLRLKEEETQSKKQSKSIKDLARGIHEKRLVSAVVRSEDIGLKFDDVGALENVKKVLYETVILPLRRPELFSHGNLLKPCKGILLFGPPGTGKTLLAKALATESGANFINITAATITSKVDEWIGETERLTRAVFSYAKKLAPVIIFLDEVDSLLGARGNDAYETSRLNEFMGAWDGLKSKESQRILVLGATNRPFDLDDAVLRRMPRRIYVGLPDVENRSKIIKVLLNKDNLESRFSFEQLAEATQGYSGSDLKNLCVAAAYRPVQEFLQQESKGEGVAALRPLDLNDFILAKAKVRASVAHNASSIMKLREWNEEYGEGETETQT